MRRNTMNLIRFVMSHTKPPQNFGQVTNVSAASAAKTRKLAPVASVSSKAHRPSPSQRNKVHKNVAKKGSHKFMSGLQWRGNIRPIRHHLQYGAFVAAISKLRTPLGDLVKAGTDEKTRSACLPNEVIAFNALRDAARSFLGQQEFHTDLVWAFSTTGSSATNLAVVSTLDPNNSAEIASFVALFDEMKMVGGLSDWSYAGTTVANSGNDAVVYYDPVNSAVPTSVSSALTADQHQGPIGLAPIPGTNGSIITTSRTGHLRFAFRMPSGPQGTDFASSSNATGQWIDVSATSPNWGYVKYYLNSSASNVLTVHGYLRVHMLFRCRQ